MFERKKSAGKIFLLPVDDIHPSPYQARTSFDEAELAGLAQSIRENGLLQPITVRKTENGYELVAGERRLRACKLAKMSTIPSILCDYSDHRTAALGLLENLQRADLNPFEQAQGLRDVMVLWDCTQAEAAKRLGMAQPTLANKLRLLQLTLDQRSILPKPWEITRTTFSSFLATTAMISRFTAAAITTPLLWSVWLPPISVRPGAEYKHTVRPVPKFSSKWSIIST